MKQAKLIREGGNIESQCPYCKARQPIGVWAAAHLSGVLTGKCKDCGKAHTIGGR